MKIRELATGLQFPEGPVAMDDGSVLLVEIARGTLTRVTADGRVQVVADLGAGPNGAAIGPDGAVYVCNNGGFEWTRDPGNCLRPIGQAHDYSGGRIERVNLNTGKFERLYEQVDGIGLRGPNDLVFDAHGGFYFTDLGKVRHHEMDRGGLFYAQPNGSGVHAVSRPVMTPNGIALSPDGLMAVPASMIDEKQRAHVGVLRAQLHREEQVDLLGDFLYLVDADAGQLLAVVAGRESRADLEAAAADQLAIGDATPRLAGAHAAARHAELVDIAPRGDAGSSAAIPLGD